ncbi:hypothetical protein PITC_040240 [Penicillium italicum]|uniref:Uncharacterized protein n=1 Tax=Penicillium italicum TaxID=40296 RepID=A0A0A2LLV3_PENIT|nr:hypothetical protein PITC_040240 [Penicillium italicum]
MAEHVVHEIADRLETLTAQSPVVQHATNVSASRLEETECTSQNSLFDALEEADTQFPTSNESDLTDIDEPVMQDTIGQARMPQAVSRKSPFVNPTAPRVSYHVSASGEVMIVEDTKTSNPTAPAPRPRPSPPAAFLSFDRLSQGLPPKPTSSPTTSTIPPPSLAVERIMGPKQPIPAQILELLEEWHEDSPYTEHPSALTGRAPSTWKNFKTFSEDGDECELSLFQISLKGQNRRSMTYRIMILHAQNGPEELVVYGKPRPKLSHLTKGIKGLYLLDWLETEKKGEVQACGLKLWRTDEDKISFSASMFDYGRKCTRLSGANDIFTARLSNTTPKKQTDANEDNEDAGSISSEAPFSPSRSRRQASTSNFRKSVSKNEERTPAASHMLWDKTNSPVHTVDNRDELRSLESPWKPQKRRRSTWSSKDEASAPMRYKMLSDTSDYVRVFKTDGAKILFEKAREFYKGMDKRTGLLCTVSGIKEVRYIGEGCVDEFDILQEDIRKSSGPGDEDRVVEVRPAMGF